MARRGKGKTGPPGYFLGFGFTALILAGLTLFLVLVVLPRRFVLSAGLRESGMSFPSEAAPFIPPEEQVTEAPPPPPPPAVVVRGPAEVFWSEVDTLLSEERYVQALPLFEEYLASFPADLGAKREFAITLQKADRLGDAARVFDEILSGGEDPTVRLLLARALRDSGRLEDAGVQYGVLMERDPSDVGLALEWGQALAWSQDYGPAAEVLLGGLTVDSTAVDVRIALGQVYYWAGKLDAADRVLSSLDEVTLRDSGALPLQREIIAALTPPEVDSPEVNPTPEPPTLREKLEAARAAEQYDTAAYLLREILAETPEDTSSLRVYADILQFRLDDLEGSREALITLESLGVNDLDLKFRLARLDFWTGRNGSANDRLTALLTVSRTDPAGSEIALNDSLGPADVAEIHALLGDLWRWRGDRWGSGDLYRLALLSDSANGRAIEGLAYLDSIAAEGIDEWESPGVGGDAYSIFDSDDFRRLDLGVDGKSVGNHWVWGFRTGSRWLGGVDLDGVDDDQRGLFLELESGRWWRWGTIRTGIHLGLEEIRPGETDLSVGASAHFSDLGGFRTDVRFDHGPAYPLTMTLQSVYGGVSQDRFSVNLARSLGPRWSLSVAGDAAWFTTGAFSDLEADRSLRVELGASLGRFMTDEFLLGVNARALRYSAPSPLVADLRLFWDPDAVVAAGVYAQWDHDLSEGWATRARFNPSMAFINERLSRRFEAVPHFSVEAGLSHRSAGYRTSLDAFYYQGRGDGYRAYGLRLSFSARDWFRMGGKP